MPSSARVNYLMLLSLRSHIRLIVLCIAFMNNSINPELKGKCVGMSNSSRGGVSTASSEEKMSNINPHMT